MKRASGPKTPAGKARSAKNARKHGLNTAPSAEDVAGWFNLILNNPAGAEEEPNSSDARRDAALRRQSQKRAIIGRYTWLRHHLTKQALGVRFTVAWPYIYLTCLQRWRAYQLERLMKMISKS